MILTEKAQSYVDRAGYGHLLLDHVVLQIHRLELRPLEGVGSRVGGGGVDADLGDLAVLDHRVEGVAFLIGQDDEALFGVKTGGEGPFDVDGVVDIHVGIDRR